MVQNLLAAFQHSEEAHIPITTHDEVLIKLGLIPRLIKLIMNPHERISVFALTCLGNLCVDSDPNSLAILKSGF